MVCAFMSFSTVFQSYQDNGQMIMKGCVQWNSIYGWEEVSSSGAGTQDSLLFEQMTDHIHTHLSFSTV